MKEKSALEKLMEISIVVTVTPEELQESRDRINSEMDKMSEHYRGGPTDDNFIIGGCD